jgi:hypothetical protein
VASELLVLGSGWFVMSSGTLSKWHTSQLVVLPSTGVLKDTPSWLHAPITDKLYDRDRIDVGDITMSWSDVDHVPPLSSEY